MLSNQQGYLAKARPSNDHGVESPEKTETSDPSKLTYQNIPTVRYQGNESIAVLVVS